MSKIYTLDLPWGTKLDPQYNVKYDFKRKLYWYNSSDGSVPNALKPYLSSDFSLSRWHQDDLNGTIQPAQQSQNVFTPHPHQMDAIKKIFDMYSADKRGFLEADATGTGKALAASTPIVTVDGMKPIRDVVAGDRVFFNNEKAEIQGVFLSHEKTHYKLRINAHLPHPDFLLADGSHRFLAIENLVLLKQVNAGHIIRYSDYDEIIKEIVGDLMVADDQDKSLKSSMQSSLEHYAYRFTGKLPTLPLQDYKYLLGTLKYYNSETISPYYLDEPLYATKFFKEVLARLRYLEMPGGLFYKQDLIETVQRVYELSTGAIQSDPGRVLQVGDIKYLLDRGLDKNSYFFYSPVFLTLSAITPELKSYTHLKLPSKKQIKLALAHKLETPISYDDNVVFLPIKARMKWVQKVNKLIVASAKGCTDSLWLCAKADPYLTDLLALYAKIRRSLGLPDDFAYCDPTYNYVFEAIKHPVQAINLVKVAEAQENFYCISVDSPEHSYLAGNLIPTHNTLSSLGGMCAIENSKRKSGKQTKSNLLIVCPKAVIPQWQQTIRSFPLTTQLFRPLIVNYQSLQKLLITDEKQVRQSKTTKGKKRAVKRAKMTSGEPIANFEYVIFDESHYLKNYPSSDMSKFAVKIARLNENYKKGESPFVIFSTATPGSSPLNLSVMSGIVAPLLSASKGTKITPDTWGAFLEQLGFAVSKSKTGWTWASVPWFGKDSPDAKKRKEYERLVRQAKTKQRRDAGKIGAALANKEAPFIRRLPTQIAGWPEQQILPYPLALEGEQHSFYQEIWSRFRQFLRLSPTKKDPKTALVETLRYRQKASLLKVSNMIDQIIDWVDNGYQVYVSLEFIETLDEYKQLLVNKKISVAEFSGRNTADRESERLRFQHGMAKVMLCTVTEGVSLHANEKLPDGMATATTRITVLHDIRRNPLQTVQALGRAHRDGQNSIAYIPYFMQTVEEKVVDSFVNNSANMSTMVGEQAKADMLMEIFENTAKAQ